MPSPKIYQVSNLQSSLTAAHNQANAAYSAANTASSTGGGGFDQANNAYAQANTAYGQANTARSDANTTFATINTSFGTVNTNITNVNSNAVNAYAQANGAYGAANNAVLKAGDTMTGQLNISSGGLLVTGNVGIGITSPTEKLEVAGRAKFVNSSFNYLLVDSTASDAYFRLAANNVVKWYFRNNISNSNALEITPDAGSANGIFLTQGGYVGIGTTNPGTKLQISESSTNPQLRIHYSGSAAAGNKGVLAFLHNRNSDNSAELLGYIQGVAQDNQSAGGIRFVSRNNTDVEVMRMVSSGNVGIGTTNPQVPLHVNRSGTSGNQTIVLGLSSDSGRPIIQFSEGTDVNSGTGMAIEYDGRGSGGTNAIRINSVDNVPVQTFMSNGWVGFGTSSPVAPLNIVHTNLPGEPYSGIIVKNTDTSGAAYTGVTADGVLQSHYRFALNGNLRWQWRAGAASGLDELALYSFTANRDVITVANTGTTQISSNNDPALRLSKSSGSNWLYTEYITSSTRRAYFGVDSSNNPIWGRDTNAGTRFIITGAPVVLESQPRFFAYGVSDGTFASGSYWIFPSTHVNTGGHYNASNGIFTAPVTGTYYFFWGNIGTPANDVMRYYIQKNNSAIGDFHNRIDTTATGGEYGHNGAVAIMLNLTAGDYVRIYFASDGGNSSYPSGNDTTNPYPYFGGYLLG